jgi:hypothetical protein
MASADRNPKDSVLRELNGSRSELGEALHPTKTQPEARRKKRQLESTVLQLNCWSGRATRFRARAGWQPRCAFEVISVVSAAALRAGQRSRLTTRAVTGRYSKPATI